MLFINLISIIPHILIELQKEDKSDLNTVDNTIDPESDVNKVIVIPLPEPGTFLNMVRNIQIYNKVDSWLDGL